MYRIIDHNKRVTATKIRQRKWIFILQFSLWWCVSFSLVPLRIWTTFYMVSVRFAGKRFNRFTQWTCSKPNRMVISRVVLYAGQFDCICSVINMIFLNVITFSIAHQIVMFLSEYWQQCWAITHLWCHENEQCHELSKKVFTIVWWRWCNILCVNDSSLARRIHLSGWD